MKALLLLYAASSAFGLPALATVSFATLLYFGIFSIVSARRSSSTRVMLGRCKPCQKSIAGAALTSGAY